MGIGGQVDVIFDRREEGEEVLFELKTDELFRTHVAHRFGPRGVLFIPSGYDGLREKIDPATICCREVESSTQGRRGDVDGCFIKLGRRSALPVEHRKWGTLALSTHTLIRISLYRSFCCRRRELVDPTR